MKLTKLGLILIVLCSNGARISAQNGLKLVIPADRQLNFTALATRGGSAQDPAQDSAQDEIKSQQQLVAELKFLRRDNAALKAENAAHKGELAVNGRIIEIERERGDFFKDAATKGIKVGDNAAVIEIKYQEIVNQYRDENERLRSENSKLRSSRNWISLLSGAGGAFVGYQACK